MAIFQIVNGKCHWRTPFTSLDEVKGKFPPDCLFVDAPDYVNEQWGFDETEIGDDRFIKPQPPEGWIYDDESGQMMPEDMAEQALEDAKNAKQAENNQQFASWLNEHPLTWKDGKKYGVTLADQQEIELNLVSYTMAIQAIDSNTDMTEEEKTAAKAAVVLEWHASKEACVAWKYEDLVALSMAIRTYIYGAYTLNQTYKTSIFAAESRKDLNAIEFHYDYLVDDGNGGVKYVVPEKTEKATSEE